MKDDVYNLPDAYLCLFENNGCDTGYDVTDFCLKSALADFSQYAYAIHEYQYILNATASDDQVSSVSLSLLVGTSY